ncbi:MAG: efflux transporter periplasmic adaptor subunit [Comamonadaceae bacterium CG_4_9_14_0_8_um_filter_60_18]|nr:MAG: efflux transporter periplasmic adaptor subunit [Comamonadaceae bacterium CG_4_9_14_0_8_um_filter_60_18]
MAKKIVYVVVAAVGIAVASAATWWRQTRPQGPQAVMAKVSDGGPGATPRVAGVEVAKVAPQALRDDAQAVGSLRAGQSVMLRPEVLGRIAALNFKDGSLVRKGHVLVQFDDTLQRAEVQQMQAQLSIAQASFKRTQELVAANFMAQQTLDTAAANVQVAQAQLALAQARLSRMAVRAPFEAVAGIRLVNVGDYVKDGADLVTLEDTRQMLVDFRLPERYSGRLKVGQTAELALDALPGRNFKAVVQAIEPLLDANGRSIGVRAVLPNAARDGVILRTGMFARVTVVFSFNEAALVVPEEAIVPQGGKQFVIKVLAATEVPELAGQLPAGTPWVSRRQEVKLGLRRQGMVEITHGLAAGDTVVVAGQQRLQKDGSPLRIVELGRSAGKPAASASQPAAAASVTGS